MQLELNGEPGAYYSIETSKDLVHWQLWMTIVSPTQNSVVADRLTDELKFYRARKTLDASASQ
jgi:hypothetical protein